MAVQVAERKRQRPDYVAEKVEALPDDVTLPRRGPRTDPRFTEAMLVAQGDPDKGWYCVGTYKSNNGAKTMARRIMVGRGDKAGKEPIQIKLPDGQWEFETRRVAAPNGAGRWSKLYAKYIG